MAIERHDKFFKNLPNYFLSLNSFHDCTLVRVSSFIFDSQRRMAIWVNKNDDCYLSLVIIVLVTYGTRAALSISQVTRHVAYSGSGSACWNAGYLSEPSVLWETLSTVDGDSELLDCNMLVFFKTAAASTSAFSASSKAPEQQGAGAGAGAGAGGGGGLLPTLTSTVSNALGALVGAGAGAPSGGASGKQLDDLAHERPARPVPFDAASTGSNSSSSSAASEATLVQQPIGAPAAPTAAASPAAARTNAAEYDSSLSVACS